MSNDSKNSKGPLIVIAIGVISMLGIIGHSWIERNKPAPPVEDNVIRAADLPMAFMTVVSTDSVIHPDRKILATSEKNWCEGGHVGNQVVVVMGQESKIMTFEELKRIMK